MSSNPIKLVDSKLGLLKIFSLDNIDQIRKESITLNYSILTPGMKITLNNFFNGEVEYLGLHEDFMQFKIGENQHLFGTEIWCNEFKKIDQLDLLFEELKERILKI